MPEKPSQENTNLLSDAEVSELTEKYQGEEYKLVERDNNLALVELDEEGNPTKRMHVFPKTEKYPYGGEMTDLEDRIEAKIEEIQS